MRELKRAGLRCEGRRVETEADFRVRLEDYQPDVILSDFSMPHFDGRTVGDRLCQALREPMSLARINGDTFAIAVVGSTEQEDIGRMLQDRVFAVLEQPFELEGHEIRVSAKAGIAVYPADGIDGESLFRNAEAALKQVKSSAEKFLFYAAEMNARVAEKLTLDHSADDLNIVSTIITLAHSLKLNVIAEGVETEAQRALLHSRHCDEMQGYLFSLPVPIDQIEVLLRGMAA